MNAEAVDKIKREAQQDNTDKPDEKVDTITQEEADRVEAVFFEYDEEITLRDGKTYKIPQLRLKSAKRLMHLLKTVNVDIVLMNFIPSGDEEADIQRENNLYEILELAFSNYPEINREYLEEYVDVALASKIFTILIGINGLKK